MKTFNRGASSGPGAKPGTGSESPALGRSPASREPGRGVELSLPPGPREFAALLDAMLVVTAVFLIRLVLELIPSVGDPYAMVALPMHLVGVAVAYLCYLITSELFFGRTLGKALLGLRVARRVEGDPALGTNNARVRVRANFFPALIRALTFFPDLLALLLFGTAHLLRGRAFGMSRMGDIYADTVVVAAAQRSLFEGSGESEQQVKERIAPGIGELPDEIAPCVQFEHEFLREALDEIMAAAGDGTRRPYVFLSSITELPEGVIEDICVVSESGLWAVGLARPGLPTGAALGTPEHPAARLRLVREGEGTDPQPGPRPSPQAARHSYQTALAQFRQSASVLTDLSRRGEGTPGERARQFNVALLVPVADYESYGLDEVEGVVSAGSIEEVFAPGATSSGRYTLCCQEAERTAEEIHQMSYLLPVMSPEERPEDNKE